MKSIVIYFDDEGQYAIQKNEDMTSVQIYKVLKEVVDDIAYGEGLKIYEGKCYHCGSPVEDHTVEVEETKIVPVCPKCF